MDPSEVDFLSEKRHVKILPNFKEGRIFLISGDIGPFEPGLSTSVPLWMAVNLKQRKKCRIIPPDWMNTDQLEQRKDDEKEREYFTEMPSKSYLEVASLLLKSARDDIPHADEVQTLIKDIWEIRMAKLRKSINIMVQEKETHARLDNLTEMEINTIRPFLTSALDHMHLLRVNVASNPRTGADY
ncbi:DNA replication complex GINS protein PSF2-like [Dendronephthya gigantea]|uniref:DNA replication complex GINS protein PSF2-like n=1 Tax=Dendronephthya gigantea TaxID=151771 RepID=UPI00106B3B4B|nr:DNA replication complex GINS protein PSF2-like [Dendronephthya gigantea]